MIIPYPERKRLKSKPKTNTINKDYILYIRQCPCILCLNPISEPHHVNLKGHGSKGMKCSDKRAIPLCHGHHMEYHRIGRSSFHKKHNIDYEYVIRRLCEIYNMGLTTDKET